MNDLSILRGSYNKKILREIDEDRYSITLPIMRRENVFSKL